MSPIGTERRSRVATPTSVVGSIGDIVGIAQKMSLMTDAVEKGLRTSPNSDSADSAGYDLGGGDDGAAGRTMESVLSISAR